MDIITELPPQSRSIKEQLLHEFPRERHPDLNTDRVENFLRENGITVKPYIVLDRYSDLKALERYLHIPDINRFISENGNNSNYVLGIHINELDLVMLKRDPKLEEINGSPLVTEGVLVHELTHAGNSCIFYVRDAGGNLHTKRSGFRVASYPHHKSIDYGVFFEEGWAEMHRGQYVAQYSSDREKRKLEGVYGISISNIEEKVSVIPRGSDKTYLMPIKYCFVLSGPRLGIPESAYAGYGIELLIKKYPHIKHIMLNARRSIEGLREFIKEINKINSRLYRSLSGGYHDSSDFASKFDLLVSLANLDFSH